VEEPIKSWTDLRAELEVATEELVRSNARLRLLEDHSSVLRSRIEKLGEELVDLQESEGESEDDGE
jgi:trans-aconitate methyltransferase